MSEGQRALRALMLFAMIQMAVVAGLLALGLLALGWADPKFAVGSLVGAVIGAAWGLWTGIGIARRSLRKVEVSGSSHGFVVTETDE